MDTETMLSYFDKGRPGPRYWGSFATICGGFILDFYDFFIVGFLLAAIGPLWHLTYGEASTILLAGGVGSIIGSLTFGGLADKMGRKPMLITATVICSLAAASIAFVPDGDWSLFAMIRVVVGIGLGGVATIQIPMLAELTPTPYRVKVTGFPLAGPSVGTLLAAFTTAALIEYLGWRGVALIGLVPLFLCISFIFVMPESPRWLVTKGRNNEARVAIAKLLRVSVASVPTEVGIIPHAPRASLTELYAKPSRFWLVIALWTCLATCNYGVYLWGPTIASMLMHVTVSKAAHYFVYVSMVGIVGRLSFAIIPNFIGRKHSGQLVGFGVAVTFAIAAFLHDDFYMGFSVFITMIIVNALFNDGGFSTLSPYTAEIFPVRLAARGLGLAQASNGMGKILGPYCLALIAGTHRQMSAAATEAAILPAFLFLAGCGLVVGICFTFFAPETLGKALALDDDPRVSSGATMKSNLSALN